MHDDDDLPTCHGVPPSAAVALAIAASIVTYVTCVRRLRLGEADFYVCAGALMLSLWLLRDREHAGNYKYKHSRIEGFLDSAVAIASDLLTPTLDRIVVGLSGKNPDGSAPKEEDAPTTVDIKPERFPDAADPKVVQLEYRSIAFLLCRMAEAYPDRYAALLRLL